MYYFYLLHSETTGRYYKGQTQDVSVRIKQHNSGKTKSTRNGIPWKLIYFEECCSREQAVKLEKYYKSLKGAKELLQKIKVVRLPEPETSPDS
jgi:putative endonuclease